MITGTYLMKLSVFLSEVFLVSPPLIFEKIVLSSPPVRLHTVVRPRHVLLLLLALNLVLVLIIVLEVGQRAIDVSRLSVNVNTKMEDMSCQGTLGTDWISPDICIPRESHSDQRSNNRGS